MFDEIKLPDDTVVQGLGHRSFFVPGALDAKGNAAWSVDGKSWFELDTQEKRYQECLEFAHELKQQYPMDGLNPDNPADLRKIAANEEAIVTALNGKIHQEYGDYNPMISSGADSRTHPSMHSDIARADTSNPAGLEEFSRGELICRHFAPLANALCTAAGMNVARMDGVFTTDYNIADGNLKESRDVGFHTAVVSMTTGNVIEATAMEDGTPYKYKVNDISVEDILAGKTLIVGDESRLTALGPGNFDGVTNELFSGRRESIASGKFDLLPTRQQYTGGKEGHDKFKSNEIAPEFFREAQQVFEQNVRGATAQFETAVGQAIASGDPADVSKVRECCEQLPISDSAMANVLMKSVKAQNWELAEFALDQGAARGFSSTFDKAYLPFMLNGQKADPQFVGKLLEKTDTSIENYQQALDKLGRSDHKGILETLRSGMQDKPAQPSVTQAKPDRVEQETPAEPMKAVTAAEEQRPSANTPSATAEEKMPPVETAKTPEDTEKETPSASTVRASAATALAAKDAVKQKADAQKADPSVNTPPEEPQQKPDEAQRAGNKPPGGDIGNPPAPGQDQGEDKGGINKWISSFFNSSPIAQIIMVILSIVAERSNNSGMEASRQDNVSPPKQANKADKDDTADKPQDMDGAKRAVDQLKASGKLAGTATGSHVADGTEVAALVPRGDVKNSGAQVG